MAGESGGEETGDVRDDDQGDLDDRDDDQGDGTGTGDDQDDDDAGQDDSDQYTPPTKDEWAKVQRTLARAKSERTKARAERDEARAALAAGKPKTDQTADSDAGKGKDDAAAQQQRQDDDARWQKVLRSSAAAQIRAAGFTGTADQAKKLTRLLNLADVEPDADGDLDLEEQIDDLKDEYPQLFRPQQQEEEPPRRVTRPTVADRGRRTERDATEDPSARTTARLLRSAGMRPR